MADKKSQEGIGEMVLANNHQYVIVNKPPGWPVQPDLTGDVSLLEAVQRFCRSPLHLVHRIDRPVSGLVVMAKKASSLAHLNEQFRERTIEKIYLAVVAQAPSAPEAELKHYLRKHPRQNRAEVLEEAADDAREAVMNYRLVGSSDRYHLLAIRLHTGRSHQIRAQLGFIGSPVRGDDKYGFKRGNPDRSIDLHAWKLSFDHPVTGERQNYQAPPPDTPVWRAFAEYWQ
jgi:23S rRNA pseudouridine1911/1915/1917 synthase